MTYLETCSVCFHEVNGVIHEIFPASAGRVIPNQKLNYLGFANKKDAKTIDSCRNTTGSSVKATNGSDQYLHNDTWAK